MRLILSGDKLVSFGNFESRRIELFESCVLNNFLARTSLVMRELETILTSCTDCRVET